MSDKNKLTVGKIIAACAELAHEANRIYSVALGDHSHEAWNNAPDWQRGSSIDGVRAVINGSGPEQCHISWLKDKEEKGWTYGPVKDPAKREHPCMVPYLQLPDEQRHKDTIFVVVVTAMHHALSQVGKGDG